MNEVVMREQLDHGKNGRNQAKNKSGVDNGIDNGGRIGVNELINKWTCDNSVKYGERARRVWL